MKSKLTIACVLKSGGDFNRDYVYKLRNACTKYIRAKFDFICLTDLHFAAFDLDTILLKHDLPGWWSKLELFQLRKEVLYFDLDTIIKKDITNKVYAMRYKGIKFAMLKDLGKTGNFESGVMYWNGDFSEILTMGKMERKNDFKNYPGDGELIRDIAFILTDGKISPIQKHFNVASFKWGEDEELEKADIICFHGKPKPHKLKFKNEFVKRYW